MEGSNHAPDSGKTEGRAKTVYCGSNCDEIDHKKSFYFFCIG